MLREDDVFMAFLFMHTCYCFWFFYPDLEDCVMFLTHSPIPPYPPPLLNKYR